MLFGLYLYNASIEILCFDYNWTVLLIELVILYFADLTPKGNALKFNLEKDLGFGILAGMVILLKQTSGIIFSVVFVFYKILNITKKEDIKEYIKIVFSRLIGVLIPVIIFAIYLIMNGILKDFVSYAINRN